MKSVSFTDASCLSVSIKSTWESERGQGIDEGCQTDPSLYQFSDMDTQTGISTDIFQEYVRENNAGMSLLEYYRCVHPEKTEDEWRSVVLDGFISVDYEVVTNPEHKLKNEDLLEYVQCKSNAQTQTNNFSYNVEEGKDGELKSSDMKLPTKVLERTIKLMERVLSNNLRSKAFEGYELIGETGSEDIIYWKTLCVDLEKKKVTYPDWTKAKHFSARITRCALTRNKERIYDIEFEDVGSLTEVREEHIRLLDAPGNIEDSGSGRNKKKGPASIRLQEGVRVHAKIVGKSGTIKYFPGRIMKCSRNGTSYDVECEGGRLESVL